MRQLGCERRMPTPPLSPSLRCGFRAAAGCTTGFPCPDRCLRCLVRRGSEPLTALLGRHGTMVVGTDVSRKWRIFIVA
jgi:hypothetical protein